MKKALILNRVPRAAAVRSTRTSTKASTAKRGSRVTKKSEKGPRPAHRPASFLKGLLALISADQQIIVYKDGQLTVNDALRLESDLLPRYFKQTTINSFFRQLNYFGFRKISMRRGSHQPAVFQNAALEGESADSILALERRIGVRGCANAADGKTSVRQSQTNVVAHARIEAHLKGEVLVKSKDDHIDGIETPKAVSLSSDTQSDMTTTSSISSARPGTLFCIDPLRESSLGDSKQLPADHVGREGSGACVDDLLSRHRGQQYSIESHDQEQRGLATLLAAATSTSVQSKDSTISADSIISAAAAITDGDAVPNPFHPRKKRPRPQDFMTCNEGVDVIVKRGYKKIKGGERNGSAYNILRDGMGQPVPTRWLGGNQRFFGAYAAPEAGRHTTGGQSAQWSGGSDGTFSPGIAVPRPRRGCVLIDGLCFNPRSCEIEMNSVGSDSVSGVQRQSFEEAAGLTIDTCQAEERGASSFSGFCDRNSNFSGTCSRSRVGGGSEGLDSCRWSERDGGCDTSLDGTILGYSNHEYPSHCLPPSKNPTVSQPYMTETIKTLETSDMRSSGIRRKLDAERPRHHCEHFGRGGGGDLVGRGNGSSATTISTPGGCTTPQQRQRQWEQTLSPFCFGLLPVDRWGTGGECPTQDTPYDKTMPRIGFMTRPSSTGLGPGFQELEWRNGHRKFQRTQLLPCTTPTTTKHFAGAVSPSLQMNSYSVSTCSSVLSSGFNPHPHSTCGGAGLGLDTFDVATSTATTQYGKPALEIGSGMMDLGSRSCGDEDRQEALGEVASFSCKGDDYTACHVRNREPSPNGLFEELCAIDGGLSSHDLDDTFLEELVLTQRQEADLIERAFPGCGGGDDGLGTRGVGNRKACVTKNMELASTCSTRPYSEGKADASLVNTYSTTRKCRGKQLHLHAKVDRAHNQNDETTLSASVCQNETWLSSQAIDGRDYSLRSSTTQATAPIIRSQCLQLPPRCGSHGNEAPALSPVADPILGNPFSLS